MNGPNRRYKVDLRAPDLPADLPMIEHWLRSPPAVRWWGAPDPIVKSLRERPPDTHALITADGGPVGYLCWQRPSGPELEAAGLLGLPEDLMDIDILIGTPELLGRGIGPRALRLLLARLSAEGLAFAGVGTLNSNLRAIRAFEKAGFLRHSDFDDPEFGPSTYLMIRLGGTVQ